MGPVGAELLYADRETDGRTGRQAGMTKLTVTLSNYANVPKSVYLFVCKLFSSMGNERSPSNSRQFSEGHCLVRKFSTSARLSFW